MTTANEDIFHKSVQHQTRVRRVASTIVALVLSKLEEADRALVALLRDKLSTGTLTIGTQKFKDFVSKIQDSRKEIIKETQGTLKAQLQDLSSIEVEAEVKLLEKALPGHETIVIPVLGAVWAATLSSPFAGGFFTDWFKALASADQAGIKTSLQMGIAQGDSVSDVIRRIAGSPANDFRDGVLAVSRRRVDTIIRTAVNHVSTEARDAVWEANSDVIVALRWTSVLDGRTTLICQGRDGRLAPIGDNPLPEGSLALEPPGARPPAHWNCRSVMTAVIGGPEFLGTRPSIQSTRTGDQRQMDFRAEAARTGRPIQDIRDEWAAEHIGQAPGEINYSDWLAQQPADFQDEVLGPARGKLFRSGTLELSQFTDPTGRTLTLDELRIISNA